MKYLIYHNNSYFNPKTKEIVCETQKEATKYLLSNKKVKKTTPNTPKKHLNYLVCKICGELSSIKEELNAIEKHGSQGKCYCEYWGGHRVFLPFYKIDKNLYLILQLYTKKQRVKYLKNLELIEW